MTDVLQCRDVHLVEALLHLVSSGNGDEVDAARHHSVSCDTLFS